jgi:hypothetical protein
MSNLKSILEKYVPRGGDEKEFMDKHTDNINVTDAPGKKEHDAIKNKSKMASREGKGYNPEEDEEVYENYFTLDDISSVLSSSDIAEEEIEYIINTLKESAPSKILSIIDEAVNEFYEECNESEKEALDEMMNNPELYEQFITELLDDESEEDEDETEEMDDEDESEEDEVIDANPTVKEKYKKK